MAEVEIKRPSAVGLLSSLGCSQGTPGWGRLRMMTSAPALDPLALSFKIRPSPHRAGAPGDSEISPGCCIPSTWSILLLGREKGWDPLLYPFLGKLPPSSLQRRHRFLPGSKYLLPEGL